MSAGYVISGTTFLSARASILTFPQEFDKIMKSTPEMEVALASLRGLSVSQQSADKQRELQVWKRH